jgi:hypothetical protein
MNGFTWFDADMCAPFGAILHLLSELNSVKLINIPNDIKRILSRNGFLSRYGGEILRDGWATTVPYEQFDPKDERAFEEYVEKKFITKTEMPKMSDQLQNKFQRNIFEVFNNAVFHSETKLGIFSCGQYYPTRNSLVFSIADLGIGIQKKIKNEVNLDFSPTDAIIWVTEKGNTTKLNSFGGLGLKLLVEFIDLNGGVIKIVSDAGYWSHSKGQFTTKLLKYPFPGTVVTIDINTADERVYRLKSELSLENIF